MSKKSDRKKTLTRVMCIILCALMGGGAIVSLVYYLINGGI